MTRTLLVAQAEAKVQVAPQLGATHALTPGGSSAPAGLMVTLTAAGLWADDVQGGSQAVALAIPALDVPTVVHALTVQLAALAAAGRITLGVDAEALLDWDRRPPAPTPKETR